MSETISFQYEECKISDDKMDIDTDSSFDIRQRCNSTSSNDSKIVNQLMEFSIPPDGTEVDGRNFQENAVRSLVRRLRRAQEKGTLNNLVRAITTNDRDTACIRIPRSLDGRMQVCQKKTIPHVLFCQIFRWQDLKSYHELQGIVSCRYAYDMSQNSGEICVNPYHYERLSHGLHSRKQFFSEDGYADQYGPNYSYVSSNPGIVSVHSEGNDWSPGVTNDYQGTNLNMVNDEPIILTEVSPTDCAATAMDYAIEAPHLTNLGAQAWCKLIYYEMKNRCGEAYEAFEDKFRIDAGTNPYAQGRFCIGSITNNNRTPSIEKIRMSIGKGITISGGHRNSQVQLVNNSSQKVFVQSAMWNEKDGMEPATVRGIPVGGRCEIFDTHVFSKKLQNCTLEGSYCSVALLSNVCNIRISFVKGWGAEYRRTHIDSCECWVEIYLLGCLQWLDHVLEKMGNPEAISSGSFRQKSEIFAEEKSMDNRVQLDLAT